MQLAQAATLVLLVISCLSLTNAQCSTKVGDLTYPKIAQLNTATSGSTGYSSTDAQGNPWVFQLCGGAETLDVTCGQTGTPIPVSVCQSPSIQGNSRVNGYATQQTVTSGVPPVGGGAPVDGLTFLYTGGAGCSGSIRQTTIYVQCLASATATAVTQVPTETAPTPSCKYTIRMTSPFACSSSAKPPGPPKGKNPGLSGGSIFLITISCFFITYMLVGIGYQYYKEARGADLCPNKDFWLTFGACIKEGCLFCWAKIRGETPAASYESVA